jgi:SNF2 family DNA or RNA helicase
MNSDNKTYLVYEKYAKNSGFNNKFTKNITVESLFMSDYAYLEGIDAIKGHNSFCETYRSDMKVSETVLNHDGLYNPYYFVFSLDGLQYRILILCVDNLVLSKYFSETKSIPEQELLITACDYDKKYKSGGEFPLSRTESEQLIKKNIKDITTIVVNPNADPTDPIEQQPEFAKLPLYEYQKKTIKWMLTKEKERKSICLNTNEVVLGNVVCDTLMKKVNWADARENIEFFGGALIDEVGLGKTYQTVATSLCNPAVNKKFKWDSDKSVHSKATLIICPNQLVGQWSREVENVIKKEHDVKVLPFFTKVHMNKYTYKEILEADFVVTSFTFLNNACFLDPFLKKITTSKTYFNSANYSQSEVEKVLDKMRDELYNKLDKNLASKDVDLLTLMWHRVIIDEFHELYAVDKYKYLQKLIYHFKGSYKWCLTGTPFNKGDDTLNGMFDFVTNYNNKSYGKEIWLNDQIIKYMTNNFFRRNTKQSVIDENRLLPLKENIIQLNFSKTEWMMYNAYMANANIDRFSVTLRQLCCHPKIAEEIKAVISNCKTLDEVEKTMTGHYEKVMNAAHRKVKLMQYRIKRLNRKLEIAEWKQYARCLRKMNYRIEFDLDDEMNEEEEKEIKELEKMIGDEDIAMPALDDYDDVLKDDEETKENLKKKLIIVSNENKDEIIRITKKEIGDKSGLRINIENLIIEANVKLNTLTTDYNGKKSSFDYYNDVVNKLKKTSTIDSTYSDSDTDSDDEKETCGICLGNITGNDLGVTKCGHIFCYNCVKPFIEKKNSCPMCNRKTTVSEIYMIQKKIPEMNTQEFKDKQTLINNVGTKLANLIFFLKKNSDKHAIIFSQWDDLLRRVGDVLNEYGIKNVFCKGNVWQRDKAIREFNNDDKIKVIMLSSESAASGTNLTKAEMVILLDPVYGSYEHRRNTEWQAIGRAYRTGQKKQVQVVRFIIKDTVEEEIYNMNKKDDCKENNEKKILGGDAEVLETKEETLNLEKEEIDELVELAKHKKEVKDEKEKTVKKVVKKKAPAKKKVIKAESESENESESD